MRCSSSVSAPQQPHSLDPAVETGISDVSLHARQHFAHSLASLFRHASLSPSVVPFSAGGPAFLALVKSPCLLSDVTESVTVVSELKMVFSFLRRCFKEKGE